MRKIETLQKLPLSEKIKLSQEIIKDWYEAWDGDVYVSFSGGKDSTVLLSLVRGMYPDVEGMFLDTGLEYPEIRNFVKTFDNISWIKPKISFVEVINKYGYPVISKEVSQGISEFRQSTSKKTIWKFLYGKHNGSWRIPKKWRPLINYDIKISHRCCHILKKDPSKKYEMIYGKHPMIGMMASDSRRRQNRFKRMDCNHYDTKRPTSNPIYFWTDTDIWEYIKTYKIKYSKIYDMGFKRTGCMFCMFGVHLEKFPNKFQLMSKTHPKHYKFCMEKLGIRKILEYLKIPYQMPDEAIKKFYTGGKNEQNS